MSKRSVSACRLSLPKQDSTIRFYSKFEPFYEFTNFYPAPIVVAGNKWPTTEHYFQAQKFVGTPYVEYIRGLGFPTDAFRVSRDHSISGWIRPDWNSVKDDVMKYALLCKFDQNKELRDRLLRTGKRKLVEHTANDSYWGDGGDGKGANRLGELLMEVREIIGSKYKVSETVSGRSFSTTNYHHSTGYPSHPGSQSRTATYRSKASYPGTSQSSTVTYKNDSSSHAQSRTASCSSKVCKTSHQSRTVHKNDSSNMHTILNPMRSCNSKLS